MAARDERRAGSSRVVSTVAGWQRLDAVGVQHGGAAGGGAADVAAGRGHSGVGAVAVVESRDGARRRSVIGAGVVNRA